MELLEREEALDQMQRLLARAGEGHGSLVFIGGEAGIGKTALIREFSTILPAGSRTLVGICDPLPTPRPHGPLHDIAAHARGGIRRLRNEELPRDAVFRETLAELDDPRGTVVLVIEDIHWADSGTLDLLRFLGRRIEATRALMLVTFRDDEVTAGQPLQRLLGDLATASAVQRISLRPLSEAAVATLAARSGLDAARLYRQTGGNPFFVSEVLAAGQEGIPATISDAVLSRAARLSPEAMAVLEIAAVIGTASEPWLLQEVAGCRSEPIDACLAAGLLREADRMFVFRHDLARAAICDAIPVYRRAALHQRVLSGLQSAPGNDINPARLAHHAEEAADRAAVLTYAPQAARRAATLGAAREAAEQYARALRFAAHLPDGERLALMEAYADVADLAGWAREGIHQRREMIALARRCGDRSREAEHLGWLSIILALEGEHDEAEAYANAARALLDHLPEGQAHARWLWHRAYLAACRNDYPGTNRYGEQAIEVAARHGDQEAMLLTLETVGFMRLTFGQEDTGRADLERCASLAKAAKLDGLYALATIDLGAGLQALFRLADAERLLDHGIAFTSERGIDVLRYWATANLAEVRCLQGRWPAATELSTLVTNAAPGVFLDFDLPAYIRIPALVTLARVRARRGDPEVWEPLAEAVRLAAPGSSAIVHHRARIFAARAEAAWLAGDRAQTAAEAMTMDAEVRALGAPWLAGELAYWQWKAGVLDELPSECAEPYARQIQGDWQDAAAAWTALGCPYEAARALGEADDEDALREALVVLDRLGARAVTVQVARRMRELGFARIPRGPRAATRANLANLTSRECEVLALMGEGMRNADIAARLYCSAKTVEHHVSAILAKLGAATRAEAIVRARELDR